MKIKLHKFLIQGGEQIKNRKPHWPDCITIDIPRRNALDLIEQLARYIQYHDQFEREIQLSFMGKLDYDIE